MHITKQKKPVSKGHKMDDSNSDVLEKAKLWKQLKIRGCQQWGE